MSFLTMERKNKKEEKMIRLEPRLRTCMYMHFVLCMFVFGNYRSSYVMVKMIMGWKTMGTMVLF